MYSGFMSCSAVDLDVTTVTKGKITKNLTEGFEAAVMVNSSENAQILWTKVNMKNYRFAGLFFICNQKFV